MPAIVLNRRNILLSVLFFLVLLAVIIWWFASRTEVVAYKVKRENAIKGITVSGTVKSWHDVRLTSGVTAKIQEIRFKEGDFVKAGQIVAVLDKKEILGNLVSARGQLVTAEAQVANLETEPRPQQAAIAQAQVREQQQNVDILQQDLQRARIQLADARSEESRSYRLYQQGAVSFRDYERASLARQQIEAAVRAATNQTQAARARLTQVRQNLSLVIAGTKSEQIQAAQGQVEAALGGVESVAGRLANYIITAPVSGYIVEKILDKGEVASPSAPILRMVMPKSLYVSAQVEELGIKQVRTGQNAYILYDAYPGMTFNGKIMQISKDVDPITGTFEAKVPAVGSKGMPVLVGMTSDITIVVKELKDVLIIPREFVFTKNKRQYVYKKIDDRAKTTYINSVEFDNNRVLIINGLKEGDLVVKNIGTRKIQPNSRIKIKQYYRG